MKLLDCNQASSLLGIPKASLAKMRWAGTGCPFVKVGARVYYRAEDLETWIASHVRTSTSALDTP